MQEPGVGLWFFGVSVVLLVVIAGPIILILRMTPWYKRAIASEQVAVERAIEVNAEYARAGFQVERGRGISLASVTGVHSGVTFNHNIYPGGRSSPPRAVVSVPSALHGDFRITHNDMADSKSKTDNVLFNDEFDMQGNSREFVQAVFADAHNREVVRALFKLGFDCVELDGSEISARKLHVNALMNLPVVTEAVERLADLRNTPSIAAIAPYRGITYKQWQGFVMTLTMLAVLFCLYVFESARPLVESWRDAALREWHPIGQTIAIAAAAFIAAAVRAFKGQPRQLLMLMPVYVSVVVFAGWCAAVFANQHFDDSAILVHDVQLIKKYTVGSRGRGYVLEFKSWRQDLSGIHFEVSRSLFDKLKPGETATVSTHAGRLGIEWIYAVDGLVVCKFDPCWK